MGAMVLQRAFQLAESGKCTSVDDIQKQLKAEGLFEAGVLDGTTLRRQLRDLCNKALGKPVRERPVATAPRKTRQTRPRIM